MKHDWEQVKVFMERLAAFAVYGGLVALAIYLIATGDAQAAVEWRQSPDVPPMKDTVWKPPVRATGEIPYGCRTKFDDLLPRACLVIPSNTCFIYSTQTERDTPAGVKRDLARICSGWFWVDYHELIMGVDWASVPGRFPSQSVPKGLGP